ncbi:hypothetical protein HKX24_08650 [Sulfitobacter sp. M85]|nr:hypothetical protein [Sulfitobacter faviae]MDF3383122.1 hypothetical protein [Sulfitobacter sp. Ks11]MDF3386541.1 hypothetical protein [Sulfitobacter sp. M85]MDF3389960.1 hypothetical protein [Sulfitobacter sp. Ks16]MDF3400597.1 hypothetical protein [Sulfitobacter sp. KE39]MDF3404018.1 hypothetical protein [Sulfitobacter sp. Ks35]MDF3411096.1 hypothetical protein [Sulfitobacter sp. KE38]
MSALLIFGAGAASLAYLMNRQSRAQRAVAYDHARDHVRVAGPREMIDPPRKWNIVDEAVDESFPASDPPATY